MNLKEMRARIRQIQQGCEEVAAALAEHVGEGMQAEAAQVARGGPLYPSIGRPKKRRSTRGVKPYAPEPGTRAARVLKILSDSKDYMTTNEVVAKLVKAGDAAATQGVISACLSQLYGKNCLSRRARADVDGQPAKGYDWSAK